VTYAYAQVAPRPKHPTHDIMLHNYDFEQTKRYSHWIYYSISI